MALNIVFYNLDNLYDTVDDPLTNDDEYTPSGLKRWTPDKYRQKLHNLSDVFAAIGQTKGGLPAVIGVSEVENDTVLAGLAQQHPIANAGYKFVHYDSNDARGVDVAFFYRPDVFNLIESMPFQPVLRSGREYIGRDILYVRGLLHGEMFCFYVCHFLSRRKGVQSTEGFRRAAAETVYNHASDVRKKFPAIKIVIMGDMNDNPCDESLTEKLHARQKITQVAENEYFNPFWDLMEDGAGSSMHENRWVLYDNILVSYNLLPAGAKGLRIVPVESKRYAMIFKRKFMMRKGIPFRSYKNNKYEGGYSDHLPILIRLDD